MCAIRGVRSAIWPATTPGERDPMGGTRQGLESPRVAGLPEIDATVEAVRAAAAAMEAAAASLDGQAEAAMDAARRMHGEATLLRAEAAALRRRVRLPA
jgi:hypothetical protein